MAKAQIKNQKISEESLAKKESEKLVENKGVVIPQTQDQEKNDYQNHPKFSKFNQAGGQ